MITIICFRWTTNGGSTSVGYHAPLPPSPGLSVGTQLLPHLPHVRTVDMLLDEVLFLKDELAVF